MKGVPHYLSKAILLSPAGLHRTITPHLWAMGSFFYNVVSRFASGIGMPTLLVSLMAKVHQDMKQLPAARDLMTYMSSLVLGGQAYGDSPVVKSSKIVTSVLLFGFSMRIPVHFWQLYQS